MDGRGSTCNDDASTRAASGRRTRARRVLAAAAGVLAGLAGVAAPPPAGAQTPPSGVTVVDALSGWQSTGLTFQIGMPLGIEVVDGEWTYWVGGSPFQPGTGDDYICARIMPASRCIEPMPFERKGGLIGRIGRSVFFVGQRRDMVADANGVLELRMNDPDNALHDNGGALTVSINGAEVPPTATPTDPTCPPGFVCLTWTPTPPPSHTPTPSPTPTVTRTPTPTATRTPSPSPTSSDTPTASATPPPAPCAPATRPVDVVLVLDRSTSMDAAGKLEAAREAIARFVDAAAAPPGRVALVTFAGVAGINQPLSTDRERFMSALQAVRVGAGTRIDLGLREARRALRDGGMAPDRAAVIILLSDGAQNGAPVSDVFAEADAAKAAGVVVFTIGLGGDVDAGLLHAVASTASHYFFAPSAADLAALYQRVAVTIPCSALGGMVFVDRDADGAFDPAVDAPLPGVVVHAGGPASRAVASGPGGRPNYRFDDVPGGRYTVAVDTASLPVGFVATSPLARDIDLGAARRDDVDFGFARAPATSTPGTATPVEPTPATPDPGRTPSIPPPTPGRSWCYVPWAGG